MNVQTLTVFLSLAGAATAIAAPPRTSNKPARAAPPAAAKAPVDVPLVARAVLRQGAALQRFPSVYKTLPSLEVDKTAKTLAYSLGRLDEERMGLKEGDPYAVAITAASYAAAIDRTFARQYPDAGFWKGPRRRLEELVSATIELMAKNGAGAEDVMAKDDQLRDLVRGFRAAVRDFAAEQGLKATSADRGLASITYSVNYRTAPAGGKVALMPLMEYYRATAFQVRRSRWPWRTLVQNPTQLGGAYYYRIVWPNGRTTEATCEVKSAADLTFQ